MQNYCSYRGWSRYSSTVRSSLHSFASYSRKFMSTEASTLISLHSSKWYQCPIKTLESPDHIYSLYRPTSVRTCVYRQTAQKNRFDSLYYCFHKFGVNFVCYIIIAEFSWLLRSRKTCICRPIPVRNDNNMNCCRPMLFFYPVCIAIPPGGVCDRVNSHTTIQDCLIQSPLFH